MIMAMMELILFVTTILPCLCSGAGVELTASPSPVTEGGSLTLTCSGIETNFSVASVLYNNETHIVKLEEGVCTDYNDHVCDQQCSCNTDGQSVTWTIFNVTRSLDKERVQCRLVYNSTLTANSDILEISVKHPPNGKFSMTPSGTQSFVTGTSVILLCQVGGAADHDNSTDHDVTVYTTNVEGTSEITTSTFKTTTVADRDISTNYDVTIYTSNAEGTSEILTSTFKTTTAKPSGGNIVIIVTAAGSASAVFLIVCVVVVIIRRRRHPPEQKPAKDEHGEDNDGLKVNVLYESAGPNYPQQPGPSNRNPSGRDVYAAVDKSKSNVTKDGLKLNVLYESAGPNYPQQPGPSNNDQSSRDVHAVVDKSKSNVAETQLYAEVNTQTKGALDSTEYAEVQPTETGKAIKDVGMVNNPMKEVPDADYAEVTKLKNGKSVKKGMVNEDIADVDGTGAQSDQQQGDI